MKRPCGLIFTLLFAAALSGCESPDPGRIAIRMTTELGNIDIELFPQRAPVTVKNFLALVDGGHLDGAGFYRSVSPENDNGSPPIAVVQGGIGDAPSPFAPIPHETTELSGLRHGDGALSMARAGVGTASSEFFICLGDQPALDYGGTRNADGQGFAVFGEVVAGMAVVRAIHKSPADGPTEFDYFRGQLLHPPIEITSVSRIP